MKKYIFFILIAQISFCASFHDFGVDWAPSQTTRLWQEREGFYSASFSEAKFIEKRKKTIWKTEYEAPKFPVASDRCGRYWHVDREIHGGSPKWVRTSQEPICGYRLPPEAVKDWMEMVTPKIYPVQYAPLKFVRVKPKINIFHTEKY